MPVENVNYVSDDETSTESSSEYVPEEEIKINNKMLIEKLGKTMGMKLFNKLRMLEFENNKIKEKVNNVSVKLEMERIAKNEIIKQYKIIEKHYDNEKCSICREVPGEKVVLGCKHLFHTECIGRWDKDSCPMCRQRIKIELFKFKSRVLKYEHKVI